MLQIAIKMNFHFYNVHEILLKVELRFIIEDKMSLQLGDGWIKTFYFPLHVPIQLKIRYCRKKALITLNPSYTDAVFRLHIFLIF